MKRRNVIKRVLKRVNDISALESGIKNRVGSKPTSRSRKVKARDVIG